MYTHTCTHVLKYVLLATKKHKIKNKRMEERNVVVTGNAAAGRAGRGRGKNFQSHR